MSKIKIGDIENNITIASVDGKWGHVDGYGNVVTEFIYDGTWYYNCGLAKVKKGNKYGYVNIKGELVIPIIYDMTYSFVKGKTFVRIGDKKMEIDTQGLEIKPKADKHGNYVLF